MSENIRICIKDFISSDIAVVAEDGKKVNAEIRKCLVDSKHVTIDFEEVDLVNTAFLNTAIGELYKDYTSDFLNEYLKILINESDFTSLKLVIERAKEFYKNTDSFSNSVEKTFKDE